MRERFIKIAISLTLVIAILLYDRFFSLSFAIVGSQYSVYVDNVFYGNVESKEMFDDFITSELVKLNKESEYGEVFQPKNYKIESSTNIFDTDLSDDDIFSIFKEDVEFLVEGFKTKIVYQPENSKSENDASFDVGQIGDVQLKESDLLTVVYTKSREDIDEGFERILETFIDPNDISMIRESQVPENFNEVGTDLTKSFIVKGTITTQELLVPYNKILEGDELYNYLLFRVESSSNTSHIVKQGEDLEEIADQNMLNVQELVAANSSLVNENTIISPGQELVVSLVNPAFVVESTKVLVTEEIIPFETEVIDDPTKYHTEPEELIQDGIEGKMVKTYEIVYVNGQITNRNNVIFQDLVVPVQNKIVKKGTKIKTVGTFYGSRKSTGVATNSTSVNWGKVLQGGIRTSPYGYRWGTIHRGMDLSGVPSGTSTLAAADGLVTAANYDSYGLGYHVLIDHENGFVTVYAHHDSLDVKAGQRVVKGQRLGGMGNTGFSTGPHLHFEVWKNGTDVNPESIYGGFY